MTDYTKPGDPTAANAELCKLVKDYHQQIELLQELNYSLARINNLRLGQIEELEASNERLRSQVGILSDENKRLQEELTELAQKYETISCWVGLTPRQEV
jgi:predicted  nucleic acid-binding Zn-ribbon protein